MPDTPESSENTPPDTGEGAPPADAVMAELAAQAKAQHDAMQQAEDAVAAAVQNTRQMLKR